MTPRAMWTGVVVVLLLTAGQEAVAAPPDVFSLSYDVPYQFEFTGSGLSANTFNGYKVAVGTPIFLGAGVSHYSATVVGLGPGGTDVTFNYDFTDITLELFRAIKDFVLVGAGFGSVSTEPEQAVGTSREGSRDVTEELAFGTGNARQAFVNLALPFELFGVPVDLHLSYNAITASVKTLTTRVESFAGSTNTSHSEDALDLNARVTTVGATLKF